MRKITITTATDCGIRSAEARATTTAGIRNRATWRSLALGGATLALSLGALNVQAEITEDCILEGRVDMRKAEHIGQPVYVRFDRAYSGSEARCTLNREHNRRRVKFVASPNLDELADVDHGERVRYRYIERDGEAGDWELIQVSGERQD
ncbi:MAG: hypothetical protein V2I82_13355 [Halieaceae bacterium]|jgi:hypothetical protein|nr:hypothetical protein [Halieaceae bacterium]